MQTRHSPSARRLTVAVLLGCGLALAVACGDATGGAVAYETDQGPGSPGRAIRLARRSSKCGRTTSGQLSTQVGEGPEFDAKDVAGLPPACDGVPSPAIEVHVEGHEVVLDFAQVSGDGAFPRGGFEGYVLHFARDCPDMALESAWVDRQSSSLDVGFDAVETHYDTLDVNLAGVEYDATSHLVIELASVNVACLRDR